MPEKQIDPLKRIRALNRQNKKLRDILWMFAKMECHATPEQCRGCKYYQEADPNNACPFTKANQFFRER